MEDEKQSTMPLTGSNTMRLNSGTVQEAIEYWLNTVVLKHPVKVTRVRELANEHNVFEVTILTEREGD